jgi:Protein of unknown function, DUF488
MSKRKLAAALADAGIDYMHLPALGNPKDNRQPFRTGDAASRQRFRARLNDEVEASRDGRWKPVYSMVISASRPRDLTAERNWAPFPTGPGVTFADRTMCGL